ncbi:MAG TPA: DUF1622 domain-containing protein [Flavobacteriia bacterium]|jgi:uncharacterized membrane protein|nr:DUF1622 domain-containing protein [Flavobacteriia bacterium]
METIKIYINYIADIVEAIGVATIFIGILYSFSVFFFSKGQTKKRNYTHLRQLLGKSILLGLEILIAADIMATVVTDPTIMSVSVLAIIVLIRTVMSLSLEVELQGKFPWQKIKN